MSLEEIRKELEQIDERILVHSVDKDFIMLFDNYKRLYKIKEYFLQLNFMEQNICELEHIRFCILENILMHRAMICENAGINFKSQLDLLKSIYKDA